MDLRLTNLTRGDATLLSGQAGRSREGGERQNQTRSDHWSTAICRVSSPPLREPTGSVGRSRPLAERDSERYEILFWFLHGRTASRGASPEGPRQIHAEDDRTPVQERL